MQTYIHLKANTIKWGKKSRKKNLSTQKHLSNRINRFLSVKITIIKSATYKHRHLFTHALKYTLPNEKHTHAHSKNEYHCISIKVIDR